MVKLDYNFEQALVSFMKSKKLEDKTKNKYLHFYHKFVNLYPELNLKNVDTFLEHNPSSPARSMIKNLLSSVLRWDFDDEIKRSVILIDIPKITAKKEAPIPKFMLKSDIDKLDFKINLHESKDTERLKIMILTQFYAGLRINELINLSFDNLKGLPNHDPEKDKENEKDKEKPKPIKRDFTKEWQKILISSESAKFGKQRTGYIPTNVYLRIMEWLKVHVKKSKKPFNTNEPIWDIKKSRYSFLFRKVTKEILNESYNTHSLRHGRGTDLVVKQKKGLEFAKKYLGHKDIKSTQIYTHISDEDIEKELEN